jgi:hypothetical protein
MRFQSTLYLFLDRTVYTRLNSQLLMSQFGLQEIIHTVCPKSLETPTRKRNA